MKLTIDLIPKTSFYNNVRSILSRNAWDKTRVGILFNTHNICEICGGKSLNRKLDCHEVWSFNDITHVQKLEKIIALCEKCHEVKHIGLAQVKGNFDRAKKHFMKINNITDILADRLINEVFNIWAARSQHDWQIDISILEEYKK